jgi:hypothetical protein
MHIHDLFNSFQIDNSYQSVVQPLYSVDSSQSSHLIIVQYLMRNPCVQAVSHGFSYLKTFFLSIKFYVIREVRRIEGYIVFRGIAFQF